jgi:hypothetical protein
MKKSIRLFIAALAAALPVAPVAAEPLTREQWFADFEQLKSELNRAYPNLEWAAARGLDLTTLETRARNRLAAAGDDSAARAAITRFLGSFGDGHMEISWPSSSTPFAATEAAKPGVCKRLGYPDWPDNSAIARGLPNYQRIPLPAGGVAAGILEQGGKKTGVLRVPFFMPDAEHCEQALRQTGTDPAGECDDACRERVERQADRILVSSIETAIRALVDIKPDVLWVDVAGNGGGNDSAIAMARMLSKAPLVTPRMRYVRSAERAADLKESAAALAGFLKQGDASEKRFLRPIVESLEAAAREAAQPCDLSPLWQKTPAACSNLVGGPFFAAGLIDAELPAGFRSRPWAERVSTTARYDFTPALWTGPLVILVDEGSASATELLTAMLQDAGRVLVVGSPTAGSGCGWTLPRRTTELKHSKGKLVMPDCVRLRRDGTNELDGIQPGVLIGFRRHDSLAQRTDRLRRAGAAVQAGIDAFGKP